MRSFHSRTNSPPPPHHLHDPGCSLRCRAFAISWTEAYETEEQTDQPTDARTVDRTNGEQPSKEDDTSESVSSVGYPLEMTRCPVWDGTQFVAKKLAYEEMGYTEDGEREYHQARVRAEFELTSCRTFYRDSTTRRMSGAS